METPMSTKKTSNGTGSNSETTAVREVSAAIRRVAHDGDRVTLPQLVDATGLDPASAEQAMGTIERVTPLRAKRLVEPGEVAWQVSM
jgi:hypothetical protein